MAKKRIKSRPGFFGITYYYDENGKQLGKSRPGLLGGTRVYTDPNGNYAGWSRPGLFAKEVFIGRNNKCITSYDAFLGDAHFKNGRPMGMTRQGLFDCTYTTLDTEEENEEELCFDEDAACDDSDDFWPQEAASEKRFAGLQGFWGSVLRFLLFCVVVFAVIAFIFGRN